MTIILEQSVDLKICCAVRMRCIARHLAFQRQLRHQTDTATITEGALGPKRTLLKI